MSHDSPANLQLFSPTGSGRNSPSPRIARNTTEDALLKKDKGYRRYAAGVERALALWDSTQQEWADYISFLARLLKALQAHSPENPIVPQSDAVALRLSQCLNPALPSGVHQKALEVYEYIFSIIGHDDLARDLNIYFPGLAPVLSFASLSVRPLFLSIFENYILKLDGDSLRPALKAVIMALLPGLEDETSEDFERMVSALDKLRYAVRSQPDEIVDVKNDGESSHFWQCFFLATITNESRRQGALAFLVRRLPKFRPSSGALPTEAEAAISPEPGLLVRCFEAGLYDTQLLIQRSFLDLLVTHLPLDSPVLQQRISEGDRERLVAAAAGVVSRRDMSLNRRLWAWLLGPEPSSGTDDPEALASPTQTRNSGVDISAHHAAYFSQYGLQALTRSVIKMIDRQGKAATDRARPFRICLSFMDRLEVGGLVVPEIFLPALQSVQTYSELASKEEVDEVMRSASTFFDGVDSGLIWGKLIFLVTSALDAKISSREEAIRQIRLAKFVLARFNLKEEEMLFQHMPLMILATLGSLDRVFSEPAAIQAVDQEVVDIAFEIVDSLVQIVPDRAVSGSFSQEKQLQNILKEQRQTIFSKVRAFYEENQGNIDFEDAPFSAAEIGQYILRESARTFTTSIRQTKVTSLFDMSSNILANLIFKVQTLDVLDELDLVTQFQEVLASQTQPSFPRLAAIITVLTALQTARNGQPFVPAPRLPDVIHPLITSLWATLAPLMPKFHVETVRCMLQLHAMSPDSRMVEAAVTSILIGQTSNGFSDPAAQADSARRFAILWNHTMHELSLQSEKRGSIPRRPSGTGLPSPAVIPGGFAAILTRPLLILLDSLSGEGTELHAFTRSWLQDLPTLNRVLDILVVHLQSLTCLNTTESLAPNSTAHLQMPRHKKEDDTRQCLYYLTHVLEILKRPSHYTWVTLTEESVPSGDATRVSLQEWLIRLCLKVLAIENGSGERHLQELYKVAVMIISHICHGPFASSVRELELEVPLMARLTTAGPSLQSLLLEAALSTLKLRATRISAESQGEPKHPQQPTHRSRLSLVMDRSSVEVEQEPIPPPPQLVECLKYGFSSPASRLVLDDWVQFLTEVLPLFADAIFQNLLPLVECLCKQINKTFQELKSIFSTDSYNTNVSPESTLISLINGLEQILAKAHDRLLLQETKSTANKSPELPQGFFGNMVSGVFASDTGQARTPTANSRLTVLLCFQDTVRICFAIWTWGGFAPKDGRLDLTSASSFGYTSLRMRNRARRILEHLFAAEALECLETLVVLWTQSTKQDIHATAVMGLLNVLNGSKPKHTIPAIFNAVYSRTNPGALDPHLMSTLTSDLADTELVAFLVDYTKSLEDDAMDEIWGDCQVFLRDVLANPLPHRQILPCLLEFTAVIGQKVDNTNFGEQRRMRKELADIFTRILTAVFTTRSMGFLQEPAQAATSDKHNSTNGSHGQKRAVDVVTVLASIVPHLPSILVENDRVLTVVSSISTNVVGPTFRAKAFPDNVSKTMLDLLYKLARISQTSKMWKKDIYDAFYDQRFFNTPLAILKESWLPVLAQWTHSDKDRLPDLLSRLSAPTTAGIMFGVGAASARQEADRKTQFTLRRISLLILAGPADAFTTSLPQITEKIVELLTATPASSPSSSTRAEVIVLLRALILQTSPVHLAPLWPIINGELTSSLSSLLPDAENKDTYNGPGIIQACKLLDELVVLDPDEFQLIEWLFITDTIDAVYKPTDPSYTSSLTDEIAEILSASGTGNLRSTPHANTSSSGEPKRTLYLDPLIEALEKEENADINDMARRELVDRIIRPFLGSLAMVKFEATYGGGEADRKGVWDSIVADASGVE
ncbi:cellular morphogenesis regulator dopa [Aaosphaeria arxii CBS 175.79]|uniref:Cellular morphogenesis regulator dopa n=1 Tax=Aaosphaeria arxii CBS 175.79 TaxID=1450172 RepID=A0A6A5Y0G8_9PLEO|nr:cellular morphogenesis regulator dopa [Aaosphaeria arxii CBS 175.79]KAF2018320.1 cellular morphogenesis regulator dopa [Aaosphaeria arxii CBS 175.79]